ncbi:helix-turn-helix domain-containing protein [Brachybacterium sp. UNK5269]|uniref:helix-turn-helix transcriptional regulator n=1 Tax=Brachybacterium sp. UNK5269 TaxID=3408576 RepID=UPI003BB03D5D
MDTRLEQAREACAAGLVDEAISLVGTIISEVEDESDIVEAATLVPPPVDPLSRARVHLLTAEAATRVKAPVLRGRLETRLAETVDHFRPAGIVAPARMDELARTGDRPALLDAIAAFAGEATSRLDRSRLHLLLGSQALMDGRFDSASAHVDVAGSLGGPGSDAVYLDPVFRFALAHRTGDGVKQTLPVVREVFEGLPFAARGWLALALMAVGQRDEASRLWEFIAPHADSVPAQAPEFLIATVGNAEICAWLGDRRTAERHYDRLVPYAGQHAIAYATSPYEGPVDLTLGRLSRILGQSALAREQLRSAVAECRVVHAPAHEAIALVELARLESPGTRARAECVAAARTIADRFGLRPVLAELDDLGSVSAPGPLTPRESEIVEIVATGRSNAEIAERLFISERTVENHVSRAMLKVGVTSRTALSLWRRTQQENLGGAR